MGKQYIILLSFCISAACCWAQEVPFLNLDAEITVAPADRINTRFLEYAPAYYGTGIVFVHARDQDKQIDLKIGMPFFELMFAELGPDGLPGRSVNFSPNIRTRFHEGPACFSPDATTIYFTRTNTHNGQEVAGQEGQGTMKIYSAVKGADDWEQIQPLWFCSDEYSVFAPTVSADGSKMIFTSNMPGGYGGMDLYISYYELGDWSEPVNLGAAINTELDEAFPFLHRNGVLFFTSEGHDGMGGLDLFASLLVDGRPGAPVNLGAPFNTRKDDLTLIIDEDGMNGFFASARKSGKGKDDIYAFTCSESLFDPAGIPDPILTGEVVVRDVATDRPVGGANIWVFPMGPGGPTGVSEAFEAETTRDDNGNIVIRLIPKAGFEERQPHATSNAEGYAQIEAQQNRDVLLVVRAEGYYDLEQVLGTDEFLHPGAAQIIGLRAIESAGEPIVPPADCQQFSGTVVSEASGLAMEGVTISVENKCTRVRRVLQSGDLGQFDLCLPKGCDYAIRAEKDGFLPRMMDISMPLQRDRYTIAMVQASLEERAEELEVGDVLVLENIYYDFNKSAIRAGAAKDLESLATMMVKYPQLEIELQSHTDARGDTDYNLELSEQRAISAKEFLTARGVDGQRIKLRPMGESQLRNHCRDGVPCTEVLHQQNRRTEIKILRMDPDLKVRQPGG
ncbi:MAG: OmpA family protein [Saprospiraceae bacterium]|nr:OmpA family protein [Saprospiraceae bacterium]